MNLGLRTVLPWCLLWVGVACACPTPRDTVAPSPPEARCTWSEQFRVELWGDVVGGPLALEAAQAACEVMGSRCAGISSEWYQGFPFVLISGEKPVRDGGDYGIHYRMTCHTD